MCIFEKNLENHECEAKVKSYLEGQIPSGNNGGVKTPISVSNDALLLIVSVEVLAGGLAFAALFKRRK